MSFFPTNLKLNWWEKINCNINIVNYYGPQLMNQGNHQYIFIKQKSSYSPYPKCLAQCLTHNSHSPKVCTLDRTGKYVYLEVSNLCLLLHRRSWWKEYWTERPGTWLLIPALLLTQCMTTLCGSMYPFVKKMIRLIPGEVSVI